MEYGFIITAAGRRILAGLLAGQTLTLSRIMVGKGNISSVEEMARLTDLVQPVAEATSTVPAVSAEGDSVSFIVEYRSDLNGGLKEGFWLSEFGVFSQNPGRPEEDVLIYYATLGDFPQYVCTYNVLACILRALGDSRTPLYFLMVSSVLNIGLDFLFIVNFGLGVMGAALATVLSQAVSGVCCFLYIAKKYPVLRLSKKDFRWDFKLAAKHMGIGLPMAFQFSITAIGVIVLQGAINLFGESKIAAYAAASKVEQLVSQPAGTFGVTMANFSGQNLGAGRVDRVRKGVRQASVLTLCFAVFGMIILLTCGEALTRLFIKEDAGMVDEIIQASMHYLRICAAFFPFLFMIFIYRNAMQGIGHSFMPLMGGVVELVVRCVAALTLPGLLGYTGVCLAGPFAWLSAAVLLCISYFAVIRQVEKQYGRKQEEEISGTAIL